MVAFVRPRHGIVGWIADAFGEAVGITLIAAGIVGGAVMRRLAPSEGK